MNDLELVFLGHQSWWVRHRDVSVLIDPILGETIGHRTRLAVHPPRRVDLSALGPVDLVVLTHEHNDHVDLASLARIGPETPILVAPLMPAVVVRAVERLGRTVHRAQPGVGLSAGGLHVELLPGGRRAPVGEGRVAQVLLSVDDGAGAVTVLIGVDTVVSDHTRAELATGALPAPDLVVVANNTQVPPVGVVGSGRDLLSHPAGEETTGLDVLRDLCVDYVAGLPGAPAVALCGGGFMDTHELGVPYRFDDHPTLVALGRQLAPDRRWFGPGPGGVLRLRSTADGVRIDTDVHPCVVVDEEALAERRRRAPPTGPLPLRSVLPFPPAEVVPDTLERVDRALAHLLPALWTHPLGDAIVGCHRHAGAWCGPRRLLVRLICRADGTGVWRALDLAESAFVVQESVDVEGVLAEWPFGFEVCLQDLDALLDGQLVVWDVLGVALRHWSATGPDVAAFLCAALGEASRPRATARVLAGTLSALGIPTRATDLLTPGLSRD